jgi:hypothetical protein
MNLLGIRMKMLIGSGLPGNAPLALNEALESAEVTHGDEGRSGFQLTFQIGRGLKDLRDYSLVTHPLLQPFNRVIVVVFFNITPHTLIDGIITNHQLSASNDPGASTLTVTGEDVSVVMDLEQRPRTRPEQSDDLIVRSIIGDSAYSQYGFRPAIALTGPPSPPPNRQERTPTQTHVTDLAYIQELSQRHGFVFYVKPGDIPGTNEAYWGPPVRSGTRQGALSVNMGPHTNVESISFQYNALAPNQVAFRENGRDQSPIDRSTRDPLVRNPATPRRTIFLPDTGRLEEEQTQPSARARAQAQVNESMDEVVTASGELNALHYGRILEPRSLVDLRGAGESYDGTYYVKSVTHKINPGNGEYKQSFNLTREGLGALSRTVQV